MMEEKTDDIVTDVRELPSLNEYGLVDESYIQVNCQKDVTGTNFTQGTQDFLFNISGNQRFSPSKSYFRVKLKLTTDGAVQPTMTNRIALAENTVANLYSNAYFYVGNQDISSITQFAAQSSILRHRISKTKDWLDSVGKIGYNMDSNLNSRINDTATDGKNSEFKPSIDFRDNFGGYDEKTQIANVGGTITFSVTAGNDTDVNWKVGDIIRFDDMDFKVNTVPAGTKTITILPVPINFAATAKPFSRVRYPAGVACKNEVMLHYQPPLGIFNCSKALPSGSYKISLHPANSTKSGVESDVSGKVENTDYKLEVTEVVFFMNVFRDEKSFDNGTFYLPLEEINIQKKSLSTGGSQTQHNFSVPSSTIGLAVFAQADSQGTNILTPPSVFNDSTKSLYDINNLQITYGNVSKPKTDHKSESTSTKQFLTQRYMDTLLNAGLYNISAESFSDWLNRGPLMYFNWVRDADDRSTEVQLTTTYSAAAASTSVFLASIYRVLVKVSVSNGMVTTVQKLKI